nr:hypothetical protein Iba_chr04fCG15570 [Ipomoea batatas]
MRRNGYATDCDELEATCDEAAIDYYRQNEEDVVPRFMLSFYSELKSLQSSNFNFSKMLSMTLPTMFIAFHIPQERM